MGTKKSQREFHERQNINNEVNPLMDGDSSIENRRKGFVSNNEQTSRHDADDVSFNLEGDANLNNHEIGKRKKKNKRNSDHSDGDVETRKSRKQDVVDNDVGKGTNKRDKSEENIGDKVAKHGHGTDSAELDAIEGMSKAKDGKKDEKRRKKQKREKDIRGTEVISGRIDGKEVGDEREHMMEKEAKNGGVSENETGEAMARPKDRKKEEKKRKKKKRERDGDAGVVSDGIDGKEAGDERKHMVEKEGKNGGVMDASENETGEAVARTKDRKKEEKKRKKKQRERGGDSGVISDGIDGKEVGDEREHMVEKEGKNGGVVDASENETGEAMARNKNGRKDEKKRKKKRKRERDGDAGVISDGKEAGTERELLEGNNLENAEPSRKKRKQKIEHNVEKKKKKKGNDRSEKNIKEKGFSGTEQKSDEEVTDTSAKSTSKGASKRVSFSEDVEIFPSSDSQSDEESVQNKELVRGKRFSLEEDDMIKAAVLNYIDQRELGEEGINMILKCKKHPEVRNCWKEIAAALPWRPLDSVYHRAHVLFERDDKRKWTEEEYELVRKFHEKHGADWRTLGDALGKHRFHVKDTWRRINVANRKRGQWSQDEYQSLFDLVNMDLRMRVFEERKSKHGMLRDNISWTAISNQLGTRATAYCCTKWYDSLSSPLVAEGKWLDVDDYRLVIALYEMDACCMEDIDWDSLLEHRPGDICRKRWNQMVKHLGELQNKSFSEQVEVLMNRYCPDVLEAREVYESKPIVDLV